MFRRWRSSAMLVVVICLLYLNLNLCWSLNDEGFALLKFREKVVSDPFGALSNWNYDVGAIDDHCSWFGVDCSDGNVVALNLKDLCLGGTLAPELGNLGHIKFLVLRNNSFAGTIPEEIGRLSKLELLDLECNNFNGPFPFDRGIIPTLRILLLDDNVQTKDVVAHRSVQEIAVNGTVNNNGSNLETSMPPPPPAAEAPATLPSFPTPPSLEPSIEPSPPFNLEPPPAPGFPIPEVPALSPPPMGSPTLSAKKSNSKKRPIIFFSGIGCSILLIVLVVGVFYYHGSKMASVEPWATGLSGPLRKAFVAGVRNLKRSELETACEDFSNVIGTSSIGTVYKGTLSSGEEIAVASVAFTSANEWSKNLEAQYRRKIETLSKVNHKNFLNLIGYCKEQEPFTRMMVFEYAPNGTLFEHLHIKEAEHLDWGTRMRILMGMAYCLGHMHQLAQPRTLKNLNSSSVYLSEDYAAKISNFGIWNMVVADITESPPESNVYSFGVLLFEMITGRMPFAVDNGASLEDWASDYLRGGRPFRETVDPTLESFQVDQLEEIGEVIRCCIHPNPKGRPTMREVAGRLRAITGIGPDGATPKINPLWWAELEILSTDAV